MKNQFFGVIYKITNLINNKVYIGQTIRNINIRFKDHIKYANNKKCSMPIALAIKKYGKENFICEIIHYCNSQEELNEKESYFINLYNSTNNKIGYNLDTYYNNRKVVHESTKEKHRILSNNPENLKRMSKLGASKRNSKRTYAKSIYLGVNKQRQGYGAELLYNNIRIWLGTYELETDAAKAKDMAELQYFKDKAVLNFPELKEQYLKNEIIINKKVRNKSGIIGISFNTRINKWVFSLKGYKVKSFTTKEEAIEYKNIMLHQG